MRDVKRLKHLPMEKGGILSSSIVTFNSIPLVAKEQFSLTKDNCTALDASAGRGITRNALGFRGITLGPTHLEKTTQFSP